MSRRFFLEAAALAGGALAVRPLTVLGGEAEPALDSRPMAIARWGGERPEDLAGIASRLTASAIESLGGMGRFVSRGDRVWIKPNIGWNRAPELAATTNPDVVATLVRLCLEAGAKKVSVGDNTCHEARSCYRTSGIETAAREAGADVVFLDERRFRDVTLGGQRLKEWSLYPDIIESDLVINVPIAKHHGLSQVTFAMKNYMGVAGGRRNAWHQDLPACLCDITAFMKPRLVVLDAVRVLTGHGPQGGADADVRRLDTVAAGTDIVAIDAFGAELLGHEPARIPTVAAAAERGLGRMHYRELDPVEVVVS